MKSNPLLLICLASSHDCNLVAAINLANSVLFTVLKGLFHPACLACVISWIAFVVAIFMEANQETTRARHAG